MTTSQKRALAFACLLGAAAVLPVFGPGASVFALLLGGALLGVPLFVLIGGLAILCYLLWPENGTWEDLKTLIERINTLADSENLLAVPLFMLSGSIMAKGQISTRLIDFSKSVIGWLPGGLAVSGVVACMLFAAISGSSPATVVAIGAMMGPTLIRNGYDERFSHGLLTSSGSLGILIPPSIPMILYPLINQRAGIETSKLFAAGFGPGLVIGGILAAFCVYRGYKDDAARHPFSWKGLGEATIDGFWSILFPLLILGGIYTGFFTVVEASAVSVVYALIVEIWVHRALEVREVPPIVQETGVILGSLLVIMVSALAFSEFLHFKHIPDAAVEVIQGWNLSPITFLIILNILLLIVGTLMDILSAMFLFVPLLAPIAESMGVDPMHFGIIFIVNLEIGYLTPPVGLNLFVASTLFEKSLGHMIRSVLPFIALMIVGLGIITYVPEVSIGFGAWIMGDDDAGTTTSEPSPLDADPLDAPLDDGEPVDDGMPSMEDMMEEAGLDDGDDGVQSMEEMMEEAGLGEDGELEPLDDDEAADDDAPAGGLTDVEREAGDRPLTMEEMMEAAGD